MKRKALALIRVSTDQQDTARQKTDVARVSQAQGLTLERTVALEDVSGRTVLSNAEVQRMLRELKRPDVAGVVISALDRLFRPDRFADFGILDAFRETGKLIFSAKEGTLDVASDSGFLLSLMSGATAGMEWRTLRQRTMGGKEERRKEGRHVNGGHCLPRGFAYKRVTDAAGRTIGGEWSYTEPDFSCVRKAYDLLFQGETFKAIARAIGHGWSPAGIRDSMRNPCWKCIRRYPADGTRTEDLEVVIPGLKPLLTPARWQAAQRLLDERHKTWSKTPSEPRFLAANLLYCACGRKYYFHSDPRRGYHDVYFCSSKHPRGSGCGSARLRRERVDAAVEVIVMKHLADAAFLARVFTGMKPPPRPNLAARERELAKLTAKRERWIDAYGEGRLSKSEFNRRMDDVERGVREVEARLPVSTPATPDVRRVITGLVRFASQFAKKPFQDKRTALRHVFHSLPVVDAALREVTLSGAFLGEFVHTNFEAHSSVPAEIGVPQNLLIRLPAPLHVG